MNDDGTKRLLAAVIVQAAADLKKLDDDITKARAACDKGELPAHLYRLAKYDSNGKKRKEPVRPSIGGADAITAAVFFHPDNTWGQTILNGCDIHVLPQALRDILEKANSFALHCSYCVGREARRVMRSIQDEELSVS